MCTYTSIYMNLHQHLDKSGKRLTFTYTYTRNYIYTLAFT